MHFGLSAFLVWKIRMQRGTCVEVVRDTTGRDVPIWYIASEAVRGE